MSKSAEPLTETMQEHRLLKDIYEREETARINGLCGIDCPLEDRELCTAAREWAFAPAVPINPDTSEKGGLSIIDKNLALACLSRHLRDICPQPIPENNEGSK